MALPSWLGLGEGLKQLYGQVWQQASEPSDPWLSLLHFSPRPHAPHTYHAPHLLPPPHHALSQPPLFMHFPVPHVPLASLLVPTL